jgi:hypothetical protein
MLDAINPYPPFLFKAHFDGFTQAHLDEARRILAAAEDDGYLPLEQGDAKSTVSNQITPPHLSPVFKDFFDWQHALANEVLFGKFKLLETLPYWISNTWLNVHKHGGQTGAHAHGMCSLSIAAYLTFPENSGFIEFKDPHFDLRSLHRRNEDEDSLLEWCSVPAVAGDVLFFPGWIQHRTQASQTDEERWVLTTNYVNVQHKPKPKRTEL